MNITNYEEMGKFTSYMDAKAYAAVHHMCIIDPDAIWLITLSSVLTGFFGREIIVTLRNIYNSMNAQRKNNTSKAALIVTLLCLLSFTQKSQAAGYMNLTLPNTVWSDTSSPWAETDVTFFTSLGSVELYIDGPDQLLVYYDNINNNDPGQSFFDSSGMSTGNIDLSFDVSTITGAAVINNANNGTEFDLDTSDALALANGANFNMAADGSSFAPAAVPEPSSFLLLSIPVLYILRYRLQQSLLFQSPSALRLFMPLTVLLGGRFSLLLQRLIQKQSKSVNG